MALATGSFKDALWESMKVFFRGLTQNGSHLDAFGRIRVSNPASLFTSQAQYNVDPLMFENGATGTGVAPSHDANTRMVKLSCTAGTGTCYRQAFQYTPYQPKKSHDVAVTGVFGAPVAGAVVDFGYFDAANGIIYRQNGTDGVQWVLRSSTSGSPVERAIDQDDWNIDRLDGRGPSKITLDTTKCFILVFNLQFLAMGRVRVGFDIDGKLIDVHEFLNANVLTEPYMQTATLPINALITATNTASTVEAYFKCSAISSEGGFEDDQGPSFGTPNATITAASGARTHLISLRSRTTYNSITNRIDIIPKGFSLLVTGSNPVFWELCVGAAFSADPTWADVNTTYSSAQYGHTGTFSNLTNGIVIGCGHVPATNQSKGAVNPKLTRFYPITLNRAGAVRALGTLSLLVTGLGGTSACNASFEYDEIR